MTEQPEDRAPILARFAKSKKKSATQSENCIFEWHQLESVDSRFVSSLQQTTHVVIWRCFDPETRLWYTYGFGIVYVRYLGMFTCPVLPVPNSRPLTSSTAPASKMSLCSFQKSLVDQSCHLNYTVCVLALTFRKSLSPWATRTTRWIPNCNTRRLEKGCVCCIVWFKHFRVIFLHPW